jgi:hypothetical protein
VESALERNFFLVPAGTIVRRVAKSAHLAAPRIRSVTAASRINAGTAVRASRIVLNVVAWLVNAAKLRGGKGGRFVARNVCRGGVKDEG